MTSRLATERHNISGRGEAPAHAITHPSIHSYPFPKSNTGSVPLTIAEDMAFLQSDAFPYFDNSTLQPIDLYLTSTPISQHNSSQGNDTGDTPYEDYKYRPETYMVPIMFGIIFVVGVVGNGTLIIVFIKHRAMRNIPNT